jgi:hypothetical protein
MCEYLRVTDQLTYLGLLGWLTAQIRRITAGLYASVLATLQIFLDSRYV